MHLCHMRERSPIPGGSNVSDKAELNHTNMMSGYDPRSRVRGRATLTHEGVGREIEGSTDLKVPDVYGFRGSGFIY